MKQGWQTWELRKSSGFTLIEVMVGILIMAATSVTMFYGVNYARTESRKLIMQQRALEELTNEMDFWMARLIDGQVSAFDLQGDRQGRSVRLYNPDSDDETDMEYFEAKIYREPIRQDYTIHDLTDNPYYKLEVYIQWEDHLGDVNGEPKELRMKYSVFKK